MQATETVSMNESAVIPLPVQQDAAHVATAGHYEAVRFNALKHGILSKLTVLPHEDAGAFSDLLAALVAEHQPSGMTEQHLVEELASIIWRKRRVLLAEGAAINQGLHRVTTNPFSSPIPAAAPFERGLSQEGTDLADLLSASPEEIAERRRDAERDLVATRKAAGIVRRGGASAYEKAQRVLLPESRDWWDESVAQGEYPPTADGLGEFIREKLEPVCMRMAQEARLIPAIQAQTLGQGLQAHRFENLSRYETHLDRKFERTLAMILKLKELRGGSGRAP